jgi:D-glycero-alpha-D-manno-heptose-7-phosphate kinase
LIISQTPLRVSFFGGGTDLKEYYSLNGGAVLSSAIDKYIYIIIKSRYDDLIVLNYSEREKVSNIDEIKHNIFREALRISGITSGVEITSIADIPSQGSGLGSSSSFTVGLLNALYAYKGEFKSPRELAEMACKIEIDLLGEPIGKQDQYAAACGGFKEYLFNSDDSVSINRLELTDEDYYLLNSCALMFYTGITRRASSVLSDQRNNTKNNISNLDTLKQFVDYGKSFITNMNIEKIGECLDQNWEVKKKLSSKIENDEINSIYEAAKKAGAYGGKLLGAGGGGFFLFLCPPENHSSIRLALKEYKELPFNFDKYGSRIILNVVDNVGFISHKNGFK